MIAIYPPFTGVEERVDGAEDAFRAFLTKEEDLGRRSTGSGERDRDGIGEGDEEAEGGEDERGMIDDRLLSLLSEMEARSSVLPSDEATVVPPLYVVVHRLMISLRCILSFSFRLKQ